MNVYWLFDHFIVCHIEICSCYIFQFVQSAHTHIWHILFCILSYVYQYMLNVCTKHGYVDEQNICGYAVKIVGLEHFLIHIVVGAAMEIWLCSTMDLTRQNLPFAICLVLCFC
jgi:hypothetical protein